MFPKSILVHATSAFLPLSGGDVAEIDRAPAATPAVEADWAGGAAQRPSWKQAGTSGVQRVEMAVLGAVGCYFAYGLGGTLGLF